MAAGRSAEGWGSRLSRRCVRGPGSRGSGREEQRGLTLDHGVFGQVDLRRKDEQGDVGSTGHGERNFGMTMVTGTAGPLDRGNRIGRCCGCGFRGSVTVPVALVCVLLGLVMRVSVRQA